MHEHEQELWLKTPERAFNTGWGAAGQVRPNKDLAHGLSDRVAIYYYLTNRIGVWVCVGGDDVRVQISDVTPGRGWPTYRDAVNDVISPFVFYMCLLAKDWNLQTKCLSLARVSLPVFIPPALHLLLFLSFPINAMNFQPFLDEVEQSVDEVDEVDLHLEQSFTSHPSQRKLYEIHKR